MHSYGRDEYERPVTHTLAHTHKHINTHTHTHTHTHTCIPIAEMSMRDLSLTHTHTNTPTYTLTYGRDVYNVCERASETYTHCGDHREMTQQMKHSKYTLIGSLG